MRFLSAAFETLFGTVALGGFLLGYWHVVRWYHDLMVAQGFHKNLVEMGAACFALGILVVASVAVHRLLRKK